MKKYIVKIIFLWIALNCILMGCTTKEELSDHLAILPDEPFQEEREEKQIGIYVDVTPSMKGFLGSREESFKELVQETRYMMCLDELNKIFVGKFNEDSVVKYRVDTPLWRVDKSENVLLEARKRGYYQNSAYFNSNYSKIVLLDNDGENYDSSCLTTALLNCIDDDFSIVVTDFYENKAAAGSVISALRKNMKQGKPYEKVVGIIGIKSEFAGDIFDISESEEAVKYGIEEYYTKDNISYRQFFVIVIGRPETVRNFCREVKENMNLNDNELRYTVFHQNEIYGLNYDDFDQYYPRNMKESEMFWENAEIVINEKEKLGVYDYKNTVGVEKDVVVSYAVNGDRLVKELGKGSPEKVELPVLEEKKLIEITCAIDENTISMWDTVAKEFKTEVNSSNFFSIKKVYYAPEEKCIYVWFVLNGTIGERYVQSYLKLSAEIYWEDEEKLDIGWIGDWNLKNNDENYEKTKNLAMYTDALMTEMPSKERLLLDFAIYIHII